MKTNDSLMTEKEERREAEETEKLLPDKEGTEEFIGEKADWSEDISEYKKELKKK